MARSSLSKYHSKRDFAQTAEPRGAPKRAQREQLRFVIQKHAATRLHYDFRLELDGVFKSWAVTRGPSLDPADKRLAVEVEDHPLEYGDFEGTIPKGQYGGGTVQLWDRGYWRPEGAKTPERAIVDGDLKFSLEGTRLKGSWVLVRMRHDRNGGKRHNWLLIKHRDASAQAGTGDALLEKDRSVASRRTMKQIATGKGKPPTPFILAPTAPATGNAQATPVAEKAQRAAKPSLAKRVPAFIDPQLCKLVTAPPSDPGWVHEVKFDGYRVQLKVQRGTAVLRTRSGHDWTARFAAIAADAACLPDCLIDGEVVALDGQGLPSFAALQAALSSDSSQDMVLYAFDLLFEERKDYRSLPLSVRKARLAQVLGTKDPGRRIRFVEHLDSPAASVLESACNMHLEGIVSKRLDARYVSGRSGFWTKAKCRAGQEVVLGGFTSDGKAVRSLLAGVYRDGVLAYVGRVGTGFGATVVDTLQPRLDALTTSRSPFAAAPSPTGERNIHWLKPTLVAEIEFAGWTGAGMIRQAAFKGLRQDKAPRDIVGEHPAATRNAPPAGARHRTAAARVRAPTRTSRVAAQPPTAIESARGPAAAGAEVMGVAISNPDKPLWPDAADGRPVTKFDLATYFESVGESMLPHLKGRPCSLVRAPDGIKGQQFFQRHAMPGMAKLFSLVTVRGDKAPYVQVDRVEALAAVAQLGALEMHPWNCVPRQPERAGRLVFDLDPAPDVDFDAVIEAALEVRDRLLALGLVPFCKTTGGKGLHVVVSLATTGKQALEWPPAKQFARLLCAQMAADSPAKYLDTMSKSQRVGRIFLDYLRNDRLSTAVAPLSPRARAGAPVSMPVAWNHVRPGLDPAAFTVRTVPALLRKSSAWADYAASARPLARAIRAITTPTGRRAGVAAESTKARQPRRPRAPRARAKR